MFRTNQRFQFSVRGLLIAVSCIAIACVPLRYATTLWSCVMNTFLVFALLFAILGAIFGRGEQRVFWGGFALFGWAYFYVATSSWSGDPVVVAPTKFLWAYLEPLIHQQDVEGWGWQALPDTGFGVKRMDQSARYFHEVGDGLVSLVAALIGGYLASLCFGQRHERTE